jgi:acetyltransferase-like isoleucine patch superfamily enzyme
MAREVDRIKVATRLSSRLNECCMDENDEIRRSCEELIGKPAGDSFHLIPSFYADFGLNFTLGRAVFIGCQCAFTGHAAITIADEVMIAHKVNLVTAGHPVEPHIRRRYITAAPMVVETNVWIGAATTLLPGESCQGTLRRGSSLSLRAHPFTQFRTPLSDRLIDNLCA